MSKRAAHHLATHLPLYVALFIALGIGSAWAASTAKKNSVVSSSIKNGQVKNADLAKNAVTAPKVKGASITTAKLADGAVGTSKLANDAVTSTRVADNSLTGQDIDESTLGTVPNADTLDGQHASNFLQSGTAAAGDLTGTYPNPAIAGDAVTSAKVANNTLTGNDIDESTLTTVPNAANATNAGNADTLDGQHAAAFALAGSSAPPSGTAGGDLSGSYPNPSIAANAVNSAKVANGSLLAADTDSTQIQSRVSGSCGAGTYMQSVAQAGTVGCATDQTAPTGAAGGALAGTYPNPTLKVSGGPCANGRALTNVSSGAALTCGPGVYSDGSGNVAAGPTSFPALSGGYYNSALGTGVLEADTSGDYNSALGNAALHNNTTGAANVAVGLTTLFDNTGGGFNVAIGTNALNTNATGNLNTALGDQALFNNTGTRNLGIGAGGGVDLTTGSHNIDIANDGIAGESATTRIGSAANQTRAFIAGVTGATIGGVASPVLVDANGQLGTTSSSRRFKREIHPLDRASRRLMKLNPVSFRYKRSYVHGPSALQFGLLAEQVAKVYPNLIVYGKDGKPSAIAYQELPALLVAQAQREKARNDRQQRQIAALRDRVRRDSHLQAEVRWLIRHTRGH